MRPDCSYPEHQVRARWQPHPVTGRLTCLACHPPPGTPEFDLAFALIRSNAPNRPVVERAVAALPKRADA